MYHNRLKQFPEEFLFGAATSAFQVEGAADVDGRGIAVHDIQPKKKGITDFSVASNHYHHYQEDIALMKELGLKAYRLSLSWVRIMPDGKTINPAGIDFYKKLLDEVTANGMEPIVTIYHFEYPQALVGRYGGWASREAIDDFERFAEVLFENFGDKVKYWLTINEQDHLLKIPSRLGISEEIEGKDYLKLAEQMNYHMCVATARVIKLCHELLPHAQIGPVINPMYAIPNSNRPEDTLAAMEFNELSTYYITELHCRGRFAPLHWKYMEDRDILPEIESEDMELMRNNTPDFLGMNYYLNQTVATNKKEQFSYHEKTVFIQEEPGIYEITTNDNITQTDWGWNICPEGMKLAIMDFYNRYQLPILVTENGLGAYDVLENNQVEDDYRIEYIHNHLSQIKDCLGLGYPVLGYCAWSFIDLVSGREGMDKRYGFVYVNRDNEELKDMRRIKKKSFYWYQTIINERGESL
uniref:glycoside hydrolase family 1 protein n=1 Tax=Candidatus Enterococcus willemsii TaxID=1857215 RepID=UPI00403F7738